MDAFIWASKHSDGRQNLTREIEKHSKKKLPRAFTRQPLYNRHMKILLSVPHSRIVNVDSVTTQAYGGTERSFAMLGEALRQLGHDVKLWWDLSNPPDWTRYDVHITQQAELMLNTPNAINIWWSHHFADQPVTVNQIGFARALADGVVCLSACHKASIAPMLPALGVDVIGHGVEFFASGILCPVKNKTLTLMYASAPFRGLDKALDIFQRVRDANPEAVLTVCSSMGMYGEEEGEWASLIERCKQTPGARYLGALPHHELLRVMSRSHALLYPSTWAETYCMVVDEALAMGCKVIASPLGALPERVVCYNDDSQMVSACLSANVEQVEPLVRPRLWASVANDWHALINRLSHRQERGAGLSACS